MADIDASNEAQLELKKRARRRLVGAVALALLAAIVLPMVMDSEPRPPVQDIQVRIPSQDGTGFASRIQPKPAATPLPPVESKSAAADVAKSESRPDAAKPTKAESKVDAPVDAAKPAAPVVAPAKAELAKAEPTPKPEPSKPADKPAVAEKATDAGHAADKPADKAPEKKADKKADEARANAALGGSEQWVVQLGAYKEAGNVKLLLGKIKQMGLPAYTEPFDSPQGERTRVRAGPFASKEAAEKAKTRIKTIGVDGPVAPK